jgi:hypothetical protein
VANALAYYNMATITAIKSFIVLAPGLLAEKGGFEQKGTLDFTLLTFLHAKRTKFKRAFVQTFNKVWQ